MAEDQDLSLKPPIAESVKPPNPEEMEFSAEAMSIEVSASEDDGGGSLKPPQP